MSLRTPMRIAAVAVTLIAIGGVSLYAFRTGRWTSRIPSFPIDAGLALQSPRHDPACDRRFPTAGEYCQAYSAAGQVTTALLGDSHAEHFLIGVGEALARRGEGVVHLGQSGCPPLLDLVKHVAGAKDECRAANASVLDFVAHNATISRVILSFRGVYDVTGTDFGRESDVRASFQLAGTSLPSDASIAQALTTTISMLQSSGKDVWLIEQVPEMDFDIAECIGRPFSFERHVRTPCAVPRTAVEARQAPYRGIVGNIARTLPSLHVFDPLPVLCDRANCYAVRDGVLVYVDNNHLSRTGSLLFADRLRFD